MLDDPVLDDPAPAVLVAGDEDESEEDDVVEPSLPLSLPLPFVELSVPRSDDEPEPLVAFFEPRLSVL